MNHINVEEIYEESDVVDGKFKLNSSPALVLFDTGTSHSFISRAFVDKNGLPTKTIGCPIKVSSAGGEMIVNFGCHDLVIEFGKYKDIGVGIKGGSAVKFGIFYSKKDQRIFLTLKQ